MTREIPLLYRVRPEVQFRTLRGACGRNATRGLSAVAELLVTLLSLCDWFSRMPVSLLSTPLLSHRLQRTAPVTLSCIVYMYIINIIVINITSSSLLLLITLLLLLLVLLLLLLLLHVVTRQSGGKMWIVRNNSIVCMCVVVYVCTGWAN